MLIVTQRIYTHRSLSRNIRKEVFKRCDYQYFREIEQILKRYVKFYNNYEDLTAY